MRLEQKLNDNHYYVWHRSLNINEDKSTPRLYKKLIIHSIMFYVEHWKKTKNYPSLKRSKNLFSKLFYGIVFVHL